MLRNQWAKPEIRIWAYITFYLKSLTELIKLSFIASCIPDCNGNEDSPRNRRAVNRRELPFVSLGHDVYAELPIQRKPEFNGDEIFIIDERSSDIGGK